MINACDVIWPACVTICRAALVLSFFWCVFPLLYRMVRFCLMQLQNVLRLMHFGIVSLVVEQWPVGFSLGKRNKKKFRNILTKLQTENVRLSNVTMSKWSLLESTWIGHFF